MEEEDLRTLDFGLSKGNENPDDHCHPQHLLYMDTDTYSYLFLFVSQCSVGSLKWQDQSSLMGHHKLVYPYVHVH